MWNTNCFERCISGDIRRYKHLFKGENPNPDDEEFGQIKSVKSRVSAITSCDLLQIYYKFATHNTE